MSDLTTYAEAVFIGTLSGTEKGEMSWIWFWIELVLKMALVILSMEGVSQLVRLLGES
jgi:hypothetical protein